MANTDTQVKTGFISNEPVVVGHAVIWLLANLGAFIVQHSHHLISASQWANFSTGWVPYITAAVLSVSAWFIRTKVTPFWKKNVEPQVLKIGLTDAELEALAQRFFESFVARQNDAAALKQEIAVDTVRDKQATA
jgi:uncharacterized membrane-anchored protein